MKFTSAIALALTHSIAVVFSGAQAAVHNLRHDDAIVRDLAGESPVVCGNTKCNKRAICVDDTCVCKPGWTDPPYCRDLNECKELDPPPCLFAGAVCVDEDPHLDERPGGQYHCACKTKEGWINGPNFNEHGPLSCGDMDECSKFPSKCHLNATCTNLQPGFNCTCNDGLQGDGVVSCLPVIKPIEVPPDTSKCGKKCLKKNSNAFCDEAVGKCACLEGFFSPSGLGGACKGRNYCNEGRDNCASKADCIPLEGDAAAGFFSCECKKGYITAPGFREGTVCVPSNECTNGSNNCNKLTEFCVDLSPPDTFLCVLISQIQTQSPTPSPTTALPTPSPTTTPATPRPTTALPTLSPTTAPPTPSPTTGPPTLLTLSPTTAPPTPSPTTTPPTTSPTTAPPTPSPTLPCTGVTCATLARCNAGTGICECDSGFSGNPYTSCLDHHIVTSNFISGTGVSNGAFTITRASGIEVGLRGKLRYNTAGDPENVFNYDGTRTYNFAATAYNSQPVWSFEWSVNTDYDGTTGLKVNALTYNLILDYDPAVAFDRNVNTVQVAFDPITPPGSGSPPDHSIGTSTTLESQGVEATDLQNYINLIAANNLIQQSWRYGFFTSFVTPAPYAGFIATTPGTFTVILTALQGGVAVAETSINIVTS